MLRRLVSSLSIVVELLEEYHPTVHSSPPLPAPVGFFVGEPATPPTTATARAGGRSCASSSAALVEDDENRRPWLRPSPAAAAGGGGGDGGSRSDDLSGDDVAWALTLSWPATANIKLSKADASVVILSVSRALCFRFVVNTRGCGQKRREWIGVGLEMGVGTGSSAFG